MRYFFKRILTAAHPTAPNRYNCAVLPVYSRLITANSPQRNWPIISGLTLSVSTIRQGTTEATDIPKS